MSALFDNCTDIQPIFKGGQKTVFRARHKDYGLVALKQGQFSYSGSLERIKREVACLSSIDSPYFPRTYEFNINDKDKSFLIIEEFIESKTLAESMGSYDSEDRIVALLKTLVEGMSILWDKKIVHRDLKPQNILIGDDSLPRIIDLGIARFLEYESLTKTIAYMGPCTPIYASPEQLLNLKHAIDARTDFFILGIVVLQLHLGFHPFHPDEVGNHASIPENIVNGVYVRPSTKTGTSVEFAYLVERMLKTQPFQRFRNHSMLSEYLIKHWS